MKRLILAVMAFLFLIGHQTTAQEKKWTLEDCITYAVTNNIGLQRQRLQTETAETNYLKSKMDMLPSLNFGSDANLGFGRSVDPVTNLITFKQNISNSYYLSSQLQIFSGFAALNTVSAGKFMLKAGIEAEKLAKNTLIVEIMGQYYRVLYSKGLEEATKMQLELSENQLFRITKLVETGREALSKQYEIESQTSSDRLDYTIARNNASLAVTTLKQMLQLEPGTSFDVMMPELENILITDETFDTDSIFKLASETLPRLKMIEYELKASDKQIAAARGMIVPSLSAGGSIYTGFYKILNEDGVEQPSFTSQLKNNNSQAVRLTLSVPLFNNYITGRSIRQARIRRDDNELRLELEKNSLYTEIENACLNYSRGRDEFLAAEDNLEFNRKSFMGVEKKFESGLVDVTSYSLAKTSLFTAETEALRTKLQVIIRKFTIQFYSTGEYDKIILN